MDTRIVTQLEEKYNNKYPKQVIRYKSRGLPGRPKLMLETDVRNFITPNNFIIENLVKKIGCGPDVKKHIDQKARIIQKWVIDNMRYIHDERNTGFIEFWQFPFESLATRQMDCEDGAILMATMMIAAGIPEWRVRVVGGLVKTDSRTAPTGGHGWCTYLRDCDNTWIPLDWCYHPETCAISERKSLKENDLYVETWFSFNNLYSWGRNSMDFEGRLKEQ